MNVVTASETKLTIVINMNTETTVATSEQEEGGKYDAGPNWQE